jgi:alpha-beta hydrolase superfamily lysophospholipase
VIRVILALSLLLSVMCASAYAASETPHPVHPAQDNTPIHEFVRSSGPIHWTGKFTFDRAPELRKQIGLPIYRWLPEGQEPRGIVLGIHGLTLHGQCYDVLARGFAAGGFVFVAPDMRGYGECNLPNAPEDTKKIDNEKSYQDIVKLAKALNDEYGQNIPIAVLGESLGTSFCVRLAAEHHELVDAIIVAAPTSRVNPLMFFAPQTIFQGLIALVKPGHEMSYSVFFKKLVSNNPAIIAELQNDPLTLKRIPLQSLMKTTDFVSKTDKWAKSVAKDTPVLLLQGSRDQAMVPHEITRLTKNIHSTDQTIRWISGYGHLLLETDYLGPPSIDAITSFIDDHDQESMQIRSELFKEMKRFGAKDMPAQE